MKTNKQAAEILKRAINLEIIRLATARMKEGYRAPCSLCTSAPADIKAEEPMHIDGVAVPVGMPLCENCFDNVRGVVESGDADE